MWYQKNFAITLKFCSHIDRTISSYKMDSKPPRRNYNEDLVNMINDLKRRKEAVGTEIENESRKRDEIQCRIDQEQKRLSHCEARLSKLQSSNEAYAKMVKEAEAAYKKIEQSSQTLLHVMKREQKVIEKDLTGEV